MVRLSNVKSFMSSSLLLMLFVLFLYTLNGCGSAVEEATSGSTASATSSTTTTTATPASIKLSANPISVKSDDSSTSMITATVLDAKNAAVQGITVTFSATGGKLSLASQTTDANGKAEVSFSSGTIDQTNRVVTITGTAGGLSSMIPITITGSTITLSTDSTNLSPAGATATLTTVAKDAGGTPLYNVPITLSMDIAGVITLSAASGNTTIEGKLTTTVTPVGAGTATVTVQGLGYTATQKYTVAALATTFRITSPTDNPKAVTTGTNLPVVVQASPGVTNVTFATTIGTWVESGSAVATIPVAGGTATATLTSLLAGMATVQAYDAANSATTASLGVAFSAPVTDASYMTLQADKSVVGLSVGGIHNTAILSATVLTAANQAVGNAPVEFTILNPTGGGETVSPVVVYTNSSGVATTTFTSGSKSSSAQGVTIKATIVGTAISATKKIVIGGTAGSVVIGTGTKITVKDDTTYQYPMAVQVADSNGNPIPGAVVTLNAWPSFYYAGVWYNTQPDPSKPPKFEPYTTAGYNNEDINENMIRDTGEDTNYNVQLDPSNSSAGIVPGTVTTDEYGVANFYLTFLKNYSAWIGARIRASTFVLGTETSSYITFTLPYELATGEAGLQPDSIFNIELTVGAAAGSTISYTMPQFETAAAVYTTNRGTFAGRVYTFTNTAGSPVGTIFYDSISISDATVGLSTRASIPVRIVVK